MTIATTKNNNKNLVSFWIIGIVSFCVRLYISFSQQLLIGNGGYYPLQVRTVLERGELAFADMPLLFYLDAGIVKLISFFGVEVSDQLIFTVIQVVDSLSITLLLIPIYKLLKLTRNTKFSYLTISVALFAVLSFYTLNLITTSQKNSLAVTFFTLTIYWFIKYLMPLGRKKFLMLTFTFLVFTGLTHFGTFAFAILTCTVFLLFHFKKKAFIPLSTLLIFGLTLIYYFDSDRFARLVFVWQELLNISPRIPQIIQLIIYLSLAFLFIKGYRKFKQHFTSNEKTVLKTLVALLIIIPLPIIEPQFTQRLTVFLFIPLLLLILFFSPFISKTFKQFSSASLILVTLVSIVFSISMKPPHGLTKNIISDLKNLNQFVENPSKSVIISKHNLEFWVAYNLRVNVSQESKFDSTLINDYEHVYIINQTKGLNERHHPPQTKNGRSHFEEPIVPKNSKLIGSTEYFQLYQFK